MDMPAFANTLRDDPWEPWTDARDYDPAPLSRPEAGPPPPAPMPAPVVGTPRPQRERPRWAVLGAIVAFHAVLLAGLLTIQSQPGKRVHTERLTTFSLETPPPPPPPASQPAEPIMEAAAPLVAPTPRIALPRPAITRTAPERPLPIMAAPVTTIVPAAAPAAATPVAAPAPAPAPAPLIPPNFSASQLNNPGPPYPFLSRKGREEGVVLLRVLVSANGRADKLDVDTSSGFERLDEAALKTVRKWRFVPASQAGRPREAWVLVPITFSLG